MHNIFKRLGNLVSVDRDTGWADISSSVNLAYITLDKNWAEVNDEADFIKNHLDFLNGFKEKRFSWAKDAQDIIDGMEILINDINKREDIRTKYLAEVKSLENALRILDAANKANCVDCEENIQCDLVSNEGNEEVFMCEGCSINRAEDAHEALLSDFHGGSSPVTAKERQEEALKQKNKLK